VRKARRLCPFRKFRRVHDPPLLPFLASSECLYQGLLSCVSIMTEPCCAELVGICWVLDSDPRMDELVSLSLNSRLVHNKYLLKVADVNNGEFVQHGKYNNMCATIKLLRLQGIESGYIEHITISPSYSLSWSAQQTCSRWRLPLSVIYRD
jgi:hypothetical protein